VRLGFKEQLVGGNHNIILHVIWLYPVPHKWDDASKRNVIPVPKGLAWWREEDLPGLTSVMRAVYECPEPRFQAVPFGHSKG
jgi:hypothetical protein